MGRMLASGNDVAGEFFSKHGWRSSKRGDTLKKYTSRAAKQYKMHLDRKAKQVQLQIEAPPSPTQEAVPETLDNILDTMVKRTSIDSDTPLAVPSGMNRSKSAPSLNQKSMRQSKTKPTAKIVK